MSDASRPADPRHSDFVASLQQLGFSSYEARCYVGLLGETPLTGYAVSKRTGVPQPKVYEALRKLVARGVAFQVDTDPVLFAGMPPEQLLDSIASDFQSTHRLARESAQRLSVEESGATIVAVHPVGSARAAVEGAESAVARARRRIYLSASPPELEALLPALAARRDDHVDIVLIDFSRTPVELEGMRVFRHASTENSLYRHHQARHLALVVDSDETVYAVATDGARWDGVHTRNAAVIAAVKGMIRHDIDLQQIYADFGPMLVQAYGPGLQALEAYRQDGEAPATGDPTGDPTGDARVDRLG